jgi:hypothetical protein
MSDSIADRFIVTMARIRELDAHTGNEEPMRHQVRMLKHECEEIIDSAIRSAWRIANHAHGLPKDAKEARDEAVKAATTKDPA